ncbi:MAG: hypothetical protein PHP64_02190 [Actinomycetota bacterium]|nr:hypothetical protein [Actinomycetota bacterium]
MISVHMATDIVSIKTGVRQLASRLEYEAKACEQWASLARNRELPEVAVRLEEVVAALKVAYANAEAALGVARETQEQSGVADDLDHHPHEKHSN